MAPMGAFVHGAPLAPVADATAHSAATSPIVHAAGYGCAPTAAPTLIERVDAIRHILGLSGGSLPDAIERANELMGLIGNGPLPAQADRLLLRIGGSGAAMVLRGTVAGGEGASSIGTTPAASHAASMCNEPAPFFNRVIPAPTTGTGGFPNRVFDDWKVIRRPTTCRGSFWAPTASVRRLQG